MEPSLFVTQRHDGLDSPGTSGGEITGSQRNSAKDKCDQDERDRISRGDSVKQECKCLPSEPGAGDAESHTDRDHAGAVDENHANHRLIFRTERHPDTDLLSALCDTVRYHAVDAGGCYHECNERKDAKHTREKTVE